VRIDEYYERGDPELSAVKYETDLVPHKLATDVVLIGKAHAPGGKPVAHMDVSIEVGAGRKVIRIIGNRTCMYTKKNKAPSFTEPAGFCEMQIRYERAYGGTDGRSLPGMPFAYPRNTKGRGFAIHNSPEVIDGLPLPNMEDPEDLLTPERIPIEDPKNWSRQPLPQGFGWFERIWYPRCSFVGSVPAFVEPDATLREEQLGLVPKRQIALARQFKLPSFDPRFNNGASHGLVLPNLVGGEKVRLVHLTPEGDLTYNLPSDRPRITLDIGLGERELEPVLHTVCIRSEEMQMDLVWRGAHEYPGVEWLPQMRRMVARVT
jgi:hypothetical protein